MILLRPGGFHRRNSAPGSSAARGTEPHGGEALNQVDVPARMRTFCRELGISGGRRGLSIVVDTHLQVLLMCISNPGVA